MPGMDGIELCHQLRREPKFAGIPVVLVSASHEITFSAPVWDELWQKTRVGRDYARVDTAPRGLVA
jgi:CheY-like chemotaxis protein